MATSLIFLTRTGQCVVMQSTAATLCGGTIHRLRVAGGLYLYAVYGTLGTNTLHPHDNAMGLIHDALFKSSTA